MSLSEIFTAILSLSLTGSILSAIIIIIKLLFRNKFSAKWHYYVWILLIIRMVIPYNPPDSFSLFRLVGKPPANIESLQHRFKEPAAFLTEPGTSKLGDSTTTHKNAEETINNAHPEITVNTEQEIKEEKRIKVDYKTLSIIWLAGMLIMLLYIVVLNIRMHKIVSRRPHCNDERIKNILEQCKSEMNINTHIPIVIDSHKRTPFLLGIVNPKLLLPAEIIDKMPPEEMRYIFLHELVHLRRKDILLFWITTFIQALHWFNPMIWYAFYCMRQDCEVACDSAVLSKISLKENKNYGQTIINLVNTFSDARPIPGATGIATKSQVKRRIIMISKSGKKPLRWSIVSISMILILAMLSLQIGCTVNGSKKVSDTNTEGSTPVSKSNPDNSKKDVLGEFNSLVEKEDGIVEIAKFITSNTSSVSKEDASAMVLKFEELQEKYLEKLSDKYHNGSTIQAKIEAEFKSGFDMSKIDNIKDTELKNLLVETRDGGYKVETAEGTFFPIINYEFYKKFSNYVADDIKEYINVMAVESNNVPAKDAALVIGWDEVLKRALAQEEFLNKYGNSAKASEVKNLYGKYVTFALFGLNNTPLFDYEKKQMNSEAKTAYMNAVATDSNSDFMKIIKDYLDVLKKSNYKLTDDVDKFRKNISTVTSTKAN